MIIRYLAAIFLFAPLAIFGQSSFYFGAGWNFAFTPLPDLNEVIKEYNDVRPYLTQPMKSIHFLNGPELSLGLMKPKVILDFRWSLQHAKKTAQAPGNSASDPVERNLKIRSNTVGLGVGTSIIRSKL